MVTDQNAGPLNPFLLNFFETKRRLHRHQHRNQKGKKALRMGGDGLVTIGWQLAGTHLLDVMGS